MHAMSRSQQRIACRLAFGAAWQPLAVKRKLLDPRRTLPRLQGVLLGNQAIRQRNLVPIEKIGKGAEALAAVTNDRCRHAVARPEAELLQRSGHAIELGCVYRVRLPTEGAKHTLQVWHGKNHPRVQVELAVIAIDQHA